MIFTVLMVPFGTMTFRQIDPNLGRRFTMGLLQVPCVCVCVYVLPIGGFLSPKKQRLVKNLKSVYCTCHCQFGNPKCLNACFWDVKAFLHQFLFSRFSTY